MTIGAHFKEFWIGNVERNMLKEFSGLLWSDLEETAIKGI
jgi:hypothetical protein